MGTKTKIDWADATWNPVTGCMHGCEYCYARRIAKRFGGWCYRCVNTENGREGDATAASGDIHVLDKRAVDQDTGAAAIYPWDFDPTFHRYRLNEPRQWKKPCNIFVCSMADLFGNWVPDKWIREVLDACDAAPQHRYLFLTKNPERYGELHDLLPIHRHPSKVAEMWFGHTFTGANGSYKPFGVPFRMRSFVSIEPLIRRLTDAECFGIAATTDWVIVGAETGNRKDKVVPDKQWIMDIAQACAKASVPVFMKESVRDLIGRDFKQEFPW